MRTSLFTLAVAGLLCTSGLSYAATAVTHSKDGTSTTVTTTAADGTTHTTTRTYFNNPLDVNHNGIIDSTEFTPYVYSAWDLNRDGAVTQDEWASVSGRWYGAPTQTTYRTYSYWDKNGDGRITPDEVDSNIAATKIYSAWDVNNNNMIDTDEYEAATFRMHDGNNDGMISMAEWQASN